MNCLRCNAVMYSGPVRHEFANRHPNEKVVFEHGLSGRSITRYFCSFCELTTETFIPFRIIDPEVDT